MRRFTLAFALLVGCGSDQTTSYPDFQSCFDDVEDKDDSLTNVDAILACCLDHPINGESPACQDTAPACINFLTDNLAQTSASTVDVMDACQQYEDMLPAGN
jgi:hypothetical protein